MSAPAAPALRCAAELERIRSAIARGLWDEAASIAEALWARLESTREVMTIEELNAAIQAHEACEREALTARKALLADAARLQSGQRAFKAYAQTDADDAA